MDQLIEGLRMPKLIINLKEVAWIALIIMALNLTGALAYQVPEVTEVADRRITNLHIFTPFDLDGQVVSDLIVASRLNGSCFAHSVASPSRPDAYRCLAGNIIFDPCFTSLYQHSSLVCVQRPWNSHVSVLSLTEQLPPNDKFLAVHSYHRHTQPWGLELMNGKRCTALTGATGAIAGMRINYGCPGGSIIIGSIDRSGSVWRVFYRSSDQSLSVAQIGVRKAWF